MSILTEKIKYYDYDVMIIIILGSIMSSIMIHQLITRKAHQKSGQMKVSLPKSELYVHTSIDCNVPKVFTMQ